MPSRLDTDALQIAARRCRECDRRLDGRGQQAQEQDAEIQLGREQQQDGGLEQQRQHGKQRKGAQQHQQVQAPVGCTGDDRGARQLGAV
jgi:hypothetical protein